MLCNYDWYEDRFDIYNAAIKHKIATLPVNPTPGTVPAEYENIFAFLDGSAMGVARPFGNLNAQCLVYNKYCGGHFLVWQVGHVCEYLYCVCMYVYVCMGALCFL